MDLWGIEIEKHEHKVGVVLMEFFTSKTIIHKSGSRNKKKPINVVKVVSPHICVN